ncbi:DMT family protein, partial [Acinetobacter baumannii]|uniref:DMT family protein n=1 Tax=Acinetobacter baumannii TaxID=470 RepID=UPI0011329695
MKDVPLSPTVLAFVLLIISNCFMTLAWYGHLKFLHSTGSVKSQFNYGFIK